MKIAIFTFSLFGINTYVVYDPSTKKCAVVDPGMMLDEEKKAMEDFISRNHLAVEYIIDTHLHMDHVAGVAFLKEKYHAPLLAHRDDEFWGENVEAQVRMFHMRHQLENVKIDRYLEAGDVIKIGEGELKVIHVPGHSPGSVALYDAKDGFVITGDALFAGSIGRTDLPGGNGPQLIKSIKEGLFPLPDNTVVYPGHGPSTTIGDEKRSNPFLR